MNGPVYLRERTRSPAFLWRLVLVILTTGVMLGYVAEHFSWIVPAPPSDLPAGTRQLEELASSGQWWQLWWAIPRIDFPRRFHAVGPVLLATWAGFLWLVFSLQAVQVRGPRDRRLATMLIAVGLGMLSVWPTHFFHYWQEYHWHLQPSEQLGPGLRYYVIGVGLCEELAKLLCLFPLLLTLLRKRDELLALMASACVGLGFAIAENAGYFLHSGGSDLLGRFLTANPTHMTLTGLIGLAAYRGLRQPGEWGPPAVALFGVMVFVHGLYDASIALPALAEYSLLGTILFIAVVYQFFHELRTLRTKQVETVSLTANFLAGVSLAAAVTFVYLSATVGCSEAWEILAPSGLGLSLMVYLFLREMPETLVSV